MYEVEYVRIYADIEEDEDEEDFFGPNGELEIKLIKRFVKVFKRQESFDLYIEKAQINKKRIKEKSMELMEMEGIQFAGSDFWKKITKSYPCPAVTTKQSMIYFHRCSTYGRYAITHMFSELV